MGGRRESRTKEGREGERRREGERGRWQSSINAASL